MKNGLLVEILITNKWALCASSFEPLLVCFSNRTVKKSNRTENVENLKKKKIIG